MKSRHDTILRVQKAIDAEIARQGADAGELDTFVLANVASAETMACFAEDMSEELGKIAGSQHVEGVMTAVEQLKQESQGA